MLERLTMAADLVEEARKLAKGDPAVAALLRQAKMMLSSLRGDIEDAQAARAARRRGDRDRKRRSRGGHADITRTSSSPPHGPPPPAPPPPLNPPTASSPSVELRSTASPAGGEQPNWNKLVDRVVQHVNEITGTRRRMGKHRNKADARLIKARAKELYGSSGDLQRTIRQLEVVIDEKWLQSQEKAAFNGSFRFDQDWVRPSTLYRPSHFDNYLEESRKRARSEGSFPWIMAEDDGG